MAWDHSRWVHTDIMHSSWHVHAACECVLHDFVCMQLPKLMELVGLAYSTWFVYRYLLFKVRPTDLRLDDHEATGMPVTVHPDESAQQLSSGGFFCPATPCVFFPLR
jgi:hypothetical protein